MVFCHNREIVVMLTLIFSYFRCSSISSQSIFLAISETNRRTKRETDRQAKMEVLSPSSLCGETRCSVGVDVYLCVGARHEKRQKGENINQKKDHKRQMDNVR